MKISVIVPYVREWPQVAFTLRSIYENLKGMDFEVIAIDNLTTKMQEDRGTPNVKGMATEWKKQGDDWLKYFKVSDKLSHWKCKNLGMTVASGDCYWFVDSHCIVPSSASQVLDFYVTNWKRLEGCLHFPLTYHILEPQKLIYQAVVVPAKGDYHYRFHNYNVSEKQRGKVFEVPVMSTCGMVIHREYMQLLGGWPVELGIYGGGENFINFTMAVLGLKKWVLAGDALCHHGDKRGYNWNHFDYQRNRAIATYMFGGKKLLNLWLETTAKLTSREKPSVYRSIVESLSEHRDKIKQNQKFTIEEWVSKWREDKLLLEG